MGIETSAEPGDEIPVGLNVSDILVSLEEIANQDQFVDTKLEAK